MVLIAVLDGSFLAQLLGESGLVPGLIHGESPVAKPERGVGELELPVFRVESSF